MSVGLHLLGEWGNVSLIPALRGVDVQENFGRLFDNSAYLIANRPKAKLVAASDLDLDNLPGENTLQTFPVPYCCT